MMSPMGMMGPMGGMNPMMMMNPMGMMGSMGAQGDAGTMGSSSASSGSYGPMKKGGGRSHMSPYGDNSAGTMSTGQYEGIRTGSTSAASCSSVGMGKNSKGKGKGKGEFRPEKIFIARLPKTATEAGVRAYFETFGPVTKVELKMGEDGNIRGFGFVTFVSKESAQKVVENYDSNRFEGRWIACEACVPQDGSHREETKASDPLTAPERIFVGGLPRDVSEDRLRAHFSEYGEVVDIDLKYDQDGVFRGFGFVTFKDKDSADHVVSNHGPNLFEGRAIHCKRTQKFDRISRAELEAEMEADANRETAGSTGGEDASGLAPCNGLAGTPVGLMCPGMGMNMGMMNMMNAMAGAMFGGMFGVMNAGMPCGMAMPGCMAAGQMGPCAGMIAGQGSPPPAMGGDGSAPAAPPMGKGAGRRADSGGGMRSAMQPRW